MDMDHGVLHTQTHILILIFILNYKSIEMKANYWFDEIVRALCAYVHKQFKWSLIRDTYRYTEQCDTTWEAYCVDCVLLLTLHSELRMDDGCMTNSKKIHRKSKE